MVADGLQLPALGRDWPAFFYKGVFAWGQDALEAILWGLTLEGFQLLSCVLLSEDFRKERAFRHVIQDYCVGAVLRRSKQSWVSGGIWRWAADPVYALLTKQMYCAM